MMQLLLFITLDLKLSIDAPYSVRIISPVLGRQCLNSPYQLQHSQIRVLAFDLIPSPSSTQVWGE